MPYRIVRGSGKKPPPDEIISRSWWPLWPRPYRCGHWDAWRFQVRVRGAIVAPHPQDNRRCAECVVAWLRPRIIDCPLCDQPIFPGDSIWMFHVRPAGPVAPDGLGGQPFGCLRSGCAVRPTSENTWYWDGDLILPPDHRR